MSRHKQLVSFVGTLLRKRKWKREQNDSINTLRDLVMSMIKKNIEQKILFRNSNRTREVNEQYFAFSESVFCAFIASLNDSFFLTRA